MITYTIRRDRVFFAFGFARVPIRRSLFEGLSDRDREELVWVVAGGLCGAPREGVRVAVDAVLHVLSNPNRS